jgi:hypothetical protein
MALAANVFKTITHIVSNSSVGIYTAPSGYTGVVLLAQVTNIGSEPHTVSLSFQRDVEGLPNTTEVIKDYPVESSDTINLLSGKLTLQPFDKLFISGSNSSDLKFIGSVLETLN